MGTGTSLTADVLTTGVTDRQGQRNARMGAGRGVETCKMCDKTGHNARDCMLFMKREGTCGHWCMHSLGIYDTGCTYGSACKQKHERPSIEPPENDVVTAAGNAKPVSSMSTWATRVSVMATGGSPEAHGDECVLKELTVSEMESGDLHLAPNRTKFWIKNNKIWLKPEGGEETLCQNCNEGHSIITPGSDGGQHSSLLKKMVSDLATSSRHPSVPLKWASYRLHRTCRKVRYWRRAQGWEALPSTMQTEGREKQHVPLSITVTKCVPAHDANMYSCLYYDSD